MQEQVKTDLFTLLNRIPDGADMVVKALSFSPWFFWNKFLRAQLLIPRFLTFLFCPLGVFIEF